MSFPPEKINTVEKPTLCLKSLTCAKTTGSSADFRFYSLRVSNPFALPIAAVMEDVAFPRPSGQRRGPEHTFPAPEFQSTLKRGGWC